MLFPAHSTHLNKIFIIQSYKIASSKEREMGLNSIDYVAINTNVWDARSISIDFFSTKFRSIDFDQK